MKALFLAVGLVLIAVPVSADLIRKVDVDSVCRAILRPMGSRESRLPEKQYQDCFEANQAQYDRIKTLWSTLSNSQQSQCNSSPPSRTEDTATYRYIRECVDSIEILRIKEQREAEFLVKQNELRQTIPRKEFRY
jgi:hypothetical protein